MSPLPLARSAGPIFGVRSACLPSCSEQRAGYGAPKLGAGNPFGVRERHALSDKELKTWWMILLKMACATGAVGHITLKQWVSCFSLVVAIALAVCPAFGLLFSEKFFGYGEVGDHSVYLDVQPEF